MLRKGEKAAIMVEQQNSLQQEASTSGSRGALAKPEAQTAGAPAGGTTAIPYGASAGVSWHSLEEAQPPRLRYATEKKPDPENLVEVDDIYFGYGSRLIYKGMTLTIPRGKITAILGPSGTGKTTLLRLIGGQLVPNSGKILVDGMNVHKLKREDLYELRKRMSMLFQSGALFSDLNVYENVAFPLREHTKLPEILIHDLVMMKLEAVGLRGAAQLAPSELSGGMARRAALARSIALDPDLIMYDEPFVGQDPITMAVLVKLIRDLNAYLGITSVIVTHDVQEVLSIAHKVIIVADGKVLTMGTPDEVRHSSDPRVLQFINGDYDGPYAFKLAAEKAYLEDL